MSAEYPEGAVLPVWDAETGDSALPCGCVLGEGIQGYGDFYIVPCQKHEGTFSTD